MQQQAHESETLTFAAGQSAVPGRLFIEMVDQVAETCRLHQLAHRVIGSIGRRQRIGGGAPQRAKRDVGPLWHHDHLGPARNGDVTLAPWPQTGNRARERGLSSAGFSDQENSFAGLDDHVGIFDNDSAVVELDREILQSKCRAFVLDPRDRAGRTGYAGRLKMIDRDQEGSDAARRRRPTREPWIVVEQPIERRLDLNESRRCLHDLAERHGPRDVFRCTQDERDYRR